MRSILQLQRTSGNQAMRRLPRTASESLAVEFNTTTTARFAHDFSRIPVHPKSPANAQTKLTVSTPGDIYEQEAERVSDQVMRTPAPQPQCAWGEEYPKWQVTPQGREHGRLQAKQVGSSDQERMKVVGSKAAAPRVLMAESYAPPGTGRAGGAFDTANPARDNQPAWIQRTPAEPASSAASNAGTGAAASTQNSTFEPNCNGFQQKLIGLVLERTKQMVDRALVRMLFLHMDESGGSDKDYLRWFGTFDRGRARYALQTYQQISRALERGIEFTCDCDKQIYAHVFPGLKLKIHLCALFWSAPFSGLDSKPGIIVHELAHEVLRGGDFRYSTAKAEQLAIDFPWLAVRNADNYEYFAESL